MFQLDHHSHAEATLTPTLSARPPLYRTTALPHCPTTHPLLGSSLGSLDSGGDDAAMLLDYEEE